MQVNCFSAVKGWAARLGVALPRERPQDVGLLAAVAGGDRQAMESLYRCYGPALHDIAEIMLGNQTEAEDLLHDVFCEAWEKAGSYEPTRGSVGTWLLVRLRSRAIDRIKSPRCRRLIALESTHLETDSSPTEDVPAAAYLALVARRNLAKLPGAQRRILQLLFYDELSTAEVADELQIPIGTVKSRLARTLGHLRGDTAAMPGTRSASADRAVRALAAAPALTQQRQRMAGHRVAPHRGPTFAEPSAGVG